MKQDGSNGTSARASFRAIAHLWWLSARRLWRYNTILPFTFVAFMLVIMVELMSTPARHGSMYLSVLTGAALTAALVMPVFLRAGTVLESERFELLPIDAFAILLLRPLFGNPFRLVLTAAVAFACGTTIAHLAPSPGRAVLDIFKMIGWAVSGLAAIEIIDEVLRRTSSTLLSMGLQIVLVTSFIALATLKQIQAYFAAHSSTGIHGPFSSALLGGDAQLKWEFIAGVTPFILFVALLALARIMAKRYRAHPARQPQPATWARTVHAVARMAAPRAPASFAKELGCIIRVRLYWANYAIVFAISASAFSAGTPNLFALAFLLWMGASYNTLGPDVPTGGLFRYEITPRPLKETLAMRHAAILVVSIVTAIAALGFVLVVGHVRQVDSLSENASSSAYLVWFIYSASLFLLGTIAGDWMSVREPRAIGVRSIGRHNSGAGTAASSVTGFVAFVGTLITSGVLILGAVMALNAIGANTDKPRNLLLAILGTSLGQFGIYAYRYYHAD